MSASGARLRRYLESVLRTRERAVAGHQAVCPTYAALVGGQLTTLAPCAKCDLLMLALSNARRCLEQEPP